MILAALQWIAARLRCVELGRAGAERYLTRYLLWGRLSGDARRKTPCNGYLHHIHRADDDVAPHNHSWTWALTVVLHGGYFEVLGKDASRWRWRLAGSIGLLRQQTFHRIDQVLPNTWTLFVTGPKLDSWGFWVSGRLVPWRDRLKALGVTPDH